MDESKVEKLDSLNWEDSTKLAEAMRSINWKDASERQAVALTILKYVKLDIQKDDLIPMIADTEDVPLGQVIQWAVRKGMKAYVHDPGSIAPRTHITQKVLTINSELVSVHPEVEIGQLKSGRYGSLADIRAMAKNELLGTRYAAAWSLLKASVSAGSSNYMNMQSTTNLQAMKDCLVSGLNYCEDQQGGPVKAIVGRRSVLGFITELPGYAQTTLTKVDNEGFLGSWRGINIIALRQWTDGYGVNQISADNIFMVKEGTLKFARTQDVEVEEATDVDTLMWHAHFHERYGMAGLFPERNFRFLL